MKKEDYREIIEYYRKLNDSRAIKSWIKNNKISKDMADSLSKQGTRNIILYQALLYAIAKEKGLKSISTKGKIKMNRHIQRLLRNEIFVCEITKLKKLAYREEDIGRKENAIALRKMKKLSIKIAEKYGLSFPQQLICLHLGEKFTRIIPLNTCEIRDRAKETKELSPIKRFIDATEIKAYPISINIHKLASKRDVMDFINKRWFEIETNLNFYRRDINPRIRKKINTERDELVWKNKNLKPEKIIKLLSDKNIKQGLIYNDIYKILSLERKNRSRNPEI